MRAASPRPRIGRAQKSIFVVRYLRDRGLQREIEEGLNVAEAWNGANALICYGRGGDISTNRSEEVEMTALCLRILQAALVYVNALMLQDVLADEAWSGAARRARPPGPDPAVLAACAALRGGSAGHGITAAHRQFQLERARAGFPRPFGVGITTVSGTPSEEGH